MPKTVPIVVIGQATDELGKPIGRAMIFLYSSGVLGTELMGRSTTDAQGNYVIAESQLPVVTAHFGMFFAAKSPPTPTSASAESLLSLGLAWSPTKSIYASAEPNPERHSAQIAPGHAGRREPDISEGGFAGGPGRERGRSAGGRLQGAD